MCHCLGWLFILIDDFWHIIFFIDDVLCRQVFMLTMFYVIKFISLCVDIWLLTTWQSFIDSSLPCRSFNDKVCSRCYFTFVKSTLMLNFSFYCRHYNHVCLTINNIVMYDCCQASFVFQLTVIIHDGCLFVCMPTLQEVDALFIMCRCFNAQLIVVVNNQWCCMTV